MRSISSIFFLVIISSQDQTELDKFVVHEWGVVDVYQDSITGAKGFPSTCDDLPEFVIKREEKEEVIAKTEKQKNPTTFTPSQPTVLQQDPYQTEYLNYGLSQLFMAKYAQYNTYYQQMYQSQFAARPHYGKPVLNFYSEADKKITLKIQFPTGKFTVWYPEHTTHLNKCGWEALLWKDITITNSNFGIDLPKSNKCSWWDAARDHDGAYVKNGKGAEKFLFYEGLSPKDWDVSLYMGQGKAIIEGWGARYKIKDAILVSTTQDKNTFIQEINDKSEAEISGGKMTVEEGIAFVKKLLKKGGLYHKEVELVSKIWQDHFFKDPGTRLIYLLDENHVNNYLPLEITPKPDKIKRVLLVCINWTIYMEVARILKWINGNDLVLKGRVVPRIKLLGSDLKPVCEELFKNSNDDKEKRLYKYILETIEKEKNR